MLGKRIKIKYVFHNILQENLSSQIQNQLKAVTIKIACTETGTDNGRA